MASTLTLQLDQRDYPQPPIIGLVARVGTVTHLVAQVELHEPISVAGIGRAFSILVRGWLEPELAADSDEYLSQYLDSLGRRLL